MVRLSHRNYNKIQENYSSHLPTATIAVEYPNEYASTGSAQQSSILPINYSYHGDLTNAFLPMPTNKTMFATTDATVNYNLQHLPVNPIYHSQTIPSFNLPTDLRAVKERVGNTRQEKLEHYYRSKSDVLQRVSPNEPLDVYKKYDNQLINLAGQLGLQPHQVDTDSEAFVKGMYSRLMPKDIHRMTGGNSVEEAVHRQQEAEKIARDNYYKKNKKKKS